MGLPSIEITEYGRVVGAVGITAGPDGAVWFTERGAGKIGRMSTSGAMSEFALPNAGAEPLMITAGPDGALWFTEISGNKIGRITTDGTITEFHLPSANASPQEIVTGPDGALWFVESSGSNGKIGRITTAGSISEFALPSIYRGPNAIAAGPDGALWFTEYYANKIGRITTDGVVSEYNVPTPGAGLAAITAGPDGALWFTEFDANKIGRITTSGAITEFDARTSGAGPYGITTGPDGAIWFTELNVNKMGRITPLGTVSEYGLGSSGTRPWRPAVGPDGALWYAADTTIGRAELSKTRTGALSHIAAGDVWSTTITLINPYSAPIPVRVALYNNDGSALTLPVTITLEGIQERVTTSSMEATIKPNATLLISMGERTEPLAVGWAEVLSPGRVCGFAIFRSTPLSGQASEGTVYLQTEFPSTMMLPFENSGGFVMGVAIANLSKASATITATVWGETGTQLGVETITIAGNGHASFVLPAQIVLTSGKRGIVRFQSSGTGGLAGLGLRFSPINTFTSVPTM